MGVAVAGDVSVDTAAMIRSLPSDDLVELHESYRRDLENARTLRAIHFYEAHLHLIDRVINARLTDGEPPLTEN